MIPESLKKELAEKVAAAFTPREAAVDIMKELQKYYGWLTDEGVGEAAELIGVSPAQIEELATFYEMIYRRPVGRRVIHVCDSISCWSTGCEGIMSHIQRVLQIRAGETTGDGVFTLVPCSCLGNCGDGPTMMIGDAIYGRLTTDLVDEILRDERLRSEEAEHGNKE